MHLEHPRVCLCGCAGRVSTVNSPRILRGTLSPCVMLARTCGCGRLRRSPVGDQNSRAGNDDDRCCDECKAEPAGMAPVGTPARCAGPAAGRSRSGGAASGPRVGRAADRVARVVAGTSSGVLQVDGSTVHMSEVASEFPQVGSCPRQPRAHRAHGNAQRDRRLLVAEARPAARARRRPAPRAAADRGGRGWRPSEPRRRAAASAAPLKSGVGSGTGTRASACS